ncbi:hypothetical protein J2W59_005155 [Pseudomonas fluorescens]|nr:hypothetical protein [Pseudomonas fluorescens]
MSLVTKLYRRCRVELVQRAVQRQLAQPDDLRNAQQGIAIDALQLIYQIPCMTLANASVSQAWASRSATLVSGLTESFLSEV